jgi:hypothetical protein
MGGQGGEEAEEDGEGMHGALVIALVAGAADGVVIL